MNKKFKDRHSSLLNRNDRGLGGESTILGFSDANVHRGRRMVRGDIVWQRCQFSGHTAYKRSARETLTHEKS